MGFGSLQAGGATAAGFARIATMRLRWRLLHS
jgi:hypothetical protein